MFMVESRLKYMVRIRLSPFGLCPPTEADMFTIDFQGLGSGIRRICIARLKNYGRPNATCFPLKVDSLGKEAPQVNLNLSKRIASDYSDLSTLYLDNSCDLEQVASAIVLHNPRSYILDVFSPLPFVRRDLLSSPPTCLAQPASRCNFGSQSQTPCAHPVIRRMPSQPPPGCVRHVPAPALALFS
jgi:hypothetical protein